ncbi:MAG TPA: ThiF family adenylyltransferase [Chthoniobacteraceae bacterium]|jgi:molybdopterin/thiamine biosynthesis adenylyltransferase|nr:ThiF family adenylyltransferase [Chthoniobacteraceae bacterium]
MTSERPFRVTIVGLGNIGSQLAPLLARLPQLGAFVLIDGDSYAPENVATQNIAPGDVGFAKATVAERRLREWNPALAVVSFAEKVQDVPLGALRADVIVACVDSLAARLTISEAAWRLGVPCVDTGVHADGGLARVTVQAPGAEEPCLQCAWSDRDYARIEQSYVCGAAAATYSTNAPAWLGAFAAALAASEIAALLEGRRSSAGQVLLLDSRHHKLTATRVLRLRACRFDHTVWPIEPLGVTAEEITLGTLLAEGAALQVWNQPWVARRICPACRAGDSTLHLRGRRGATCECGAALQPVGFSMTDRLAAADAPPELLRQSAASFGLRDGDVVAVTGHGPDRYLELGARS